MKYKFILILIKHYQTDNACYNAECQGIKTGLQFKRLTVNYAESEILDDTVKRIDIKHPFLTACGKPVNLIENSAGIHYESESDTP